jgi:phage-related protein (TIGR01555 family)
MSVNFQQPEFYRLSTEGANARIHASRILPEYGSNIPFRRRRVHSGWGGSEVNRFWNSFEQYTTTHQYMMESIIDLVQGVLKVKGFNKSMTTEHRKTISDKLKDLFRRKSSIGDIVIDSEEDYQIASRTLTGYKEAMEGFSDKLVSDTPFPKSILMGMNDGGLANGSNEGDWKVWTSYISSLQSTTLTGNMSRLTEVIMRSRISPVRDVPARWSVDWRTLWEMEAKDKAAVHLQNAQARETDIRSGVVSADEARRQDDVKESYELTEAEIEEAGDGTDSRGAPSPPEPQAFGGDDIAKVTDITEGLVNNRISRDDAKAKFAEHFAYLDSNALELIVGGI